MSLFSTERVLVPIDFSEEAFIAQRQTLEFVQDASRLYVLHVLPRLEPTDPGTLWSGTDDRTRQEHVAKAFHDKCNDPIYQGIHFSIAIGDPSSEILDYAQQQSIQLIVMPSHGRTGVRRFFMGSVAERVARFAHCPVLILRH